MPRKWRLAWRIKKAPPEPCPPFSTRKAVPLGPGAQDITSRAQTGSPSGNVRLAVADRSKRRYSDPALFQPRPNDGIGTLGFTG